MFHYSIQTRKPLLTVRTGYPLLSVLRLELYANGFHSDFKSIIGYIWFNPISDIRYWISNGLLDNQINGSWFVNCDRSSILIGHFITIFWGYFFFIFFFYSKKKFFYYVSFCRTINCWLRFEILDELGLRYSDVIM